MFNLEEAITEWRRQMEADGVKNPEVMDELESHLRDEAAYQILRGSNKESAFEIALQRIGPAQALKTEFNKIDKTKETKHMKRTVIIGVGIIGILTGMALVMPAMAQYRDEGSMKSGEVLFFALGMALTLGGGGVSIHGIKKHSA